MSPLTRLESQVPSSTSPEGQAQQVIGASLEAPAQLVSPHAQAQPEAQAQQLTSAPHDQESQSEATKSHAAPSGAVHIGPAVLGDGNHDNEICPRLA